MQKVSDLFNGTAYINLSGIGESRKQREGLISLPELSSKLSEQAACMVDTVVPYGQIVFTAGIVREEYVNDMPVTKFGLLLKILDEQNQPIGSFPVADRVIQHLVNHAKESEGKSTTIGRHYLEVLLDKNTDEDDVNMAVDNLNHWFGKRAGERHFSRGKERKAKGIRRVFVRLLNVERASRDNLLNPEERLQTEKGFIVTAMLSDSYFPISSAEMVLTALRVVKGDFWSDTDPSAPNYDTYKGARVWDYYVSPYRVAVRMMNPGMAFDTRNPDRGVFYADRIESDGSGGLEYIYKDPDGGEDAKFVMGPTGRLTHENMASQSNTQHIIGADTHGIRHIVFPSVHISNDEGGGGSAQCSIGLYEVLCSNGLMTEKQVRKHVSSIIQDANESNKTREARKHLVLCEMADMLAAGFDPVGFEQLARSFYGLSLVKVKNKDKALEYVAQAVNLEGLLDDMISSYEQFVAGQDTVLDVVRAVTHVAQSQAPEIADRLERYAGGFIDGSSSLKKELLVAV